MTDLRRPEPLAARHDRGSFDCGEPSLDEWLRRYAGQNRRGNTAATWVIADRDERVVAYASLSMTALDHSAAPAPVAKGSPDPVPALLIGRFAVDRSVAGLGVGTTLVGHILATALELNEKAAFKAVVATAINDRARRWWERFGFVPLDPAASDALDLYLLTSDVRATLRRTR